MNDKFASSISGPKCQRPSNQRAKKSYKHVEDKLRRSVVLAYPESCFSSNIGAMIKMSTVLKSSQ